MHRFAQCENLKLMDNIETLLAYHHKFRFLLEELSDESAGVLKKNRLVEEFQNEIDVYCNVSASYFKNLPNNPFPEQLDDKDNNGIKIKNLVKTLDPNTQDETAWSIQIMRLKEEVEKLLFRFEKLVDTDLYAAQGST